MINIVEVGLRDGLQNEKTNLSIEHRYQLIKKLSFAGLKRIELGSFVSPKSVPQMKCVPQLARKILLQKRKGHLPKKVSYSAFVPNQRGFEMAVESGLKEVSYFISCTEPFSKKNINMSVKESLKSLQNICRIAKKVKIRVYLSAAFSCPYQGKTLTSKVVKLATQIMNQTEVFEISVSDTMGDAKPSDVIHLINALKKKIPLKKIALHFHNTYRMAIPNVMAGIQSGVTVFDSSIGGLGGCPYASKAGGNVATEDLTYTLEKMQFKTGINIYELLKTRCFLEKKLKRPLKI